MTDAKLKTRVRAKVTGETESHSRTLLKTRDLVDISDEPEARGGTNEGFAPTEMALASLAACSNVISHKIAKKNGIDIIDMHLGINAEFSRLGVMLEEEVEVPFPEILLTIDITTTASDEQLEVLKNDLPRYCPVAKVFSHSGSNIITTWNVKRP